MSQDGATDFSITSIFGGIGSRVASARAGLGHEGDGWRWTLELDGAGHSQLALPAEGTDDVVKRLLDVDAILRRSLDKVTAEGASEGLALLHRHVPVGASVTLVPHQHNGRVGARGGRQGRRRSRKVEGGRRAEGGGRGGGGTLDALDVLVEFLDTGKRRA